MTDRLANNLAKLHDLTATFGPAYSGWCELRVGAGGQSAHIQASAHFYDPFPGLILWLEAVHQGMAASTSIDEECHTVVLDFEPTCPGEGRIRITGSHENRVWLEGLASTVTLAGTVYRALHAFARSSGYNRAEWETQPFWEYLVRHSGLNRHSLLQKVEHLSATELEKLVSAAGGGAQRVSEAFEAPQEWPTWTAYERRTWFDALGREPEGPWHGAPLRELTSKLLDQAYRSDPVEES